MFNDACKTYGFYSKNIDKEFKVAHDVSDRKYWDSLAPSLPILKEVAEQSNDTFGILRLSRYLKFYTEGSRAKYEEGYRKRRNLLNCYTYIEAIEHKGDYFEDVLDLLWALLEETHWCVAAHNKYCKVHDIIPYENDCGLDLFTSDTASYLSNTYMVFKKKFDEISFEIGDRIYREICRQIYIPFLENDYEWMYRNGKPNNWNPWIVSNVLRTVINLGRYGELELKVLARCAHVMDVFYKSYPEDGSSDEGISYWMHSGFNLVDYAYNVYHLTKGRLDILNDDKTKNTARYILKTYVSNEHILGFSDGSVKQGAVLAGKLVTVGKKIGDSDLMNLGYQNIVKNKSMGNVLVKFDIDYIEAYAECNSMNYYTKLPLESGFPGVNIYIFREYQQSPFGLFMATKAGHNGESHNHNDTGNYIIYKNEVPFIVDVGNRCYDSSTFSGKRYDIWVNKSNYHNLPIVSGMGQESGKEHCATAIEYNENSISFELKKTYECVFIDSYCRKLEINRNEKFILLTEQINLTEKKDIKFVFMTPAWVEVKENKILLSYKKETLEISWSGDYKVEIESIEDDDKIITETWNKDLKRILLSCNVSHINEEFKFV